MALEKNIKNVTIQTNMNKQIYFIRHGEVQYPLDDRGRKLIYSPNTPLSVLGKLQLEKLGERLKTEKIKPEVLFTSPFTRAVQSAEKIQQTLLIPRIIQINDLRDVDPNSWEGLPIEEYGFIKGDIYSHPKSSNQETLSHLIERAKNALKTIFQSEFNLIGVVSHGDLLSAIGWVLKGPSRLPEDYSEMKINFYPQKGEAIECLVDPFLRLIGERRLITVNEVNQSREKYR